MCINHEFYRLICYLGNCIFNFYSKRSKLPLTIRITTKNNLYTLFVFLRFLDIGTKLLDFCRFILLYVYNFINKSISKIYIMKPFSLERLVKNNIKHYYAFMYIIWLI